MTEDLPPLPLKSIDAVFEPPLSSTPSSSSSSSSLKRRASSSFDCPDEGIHKKLKEAHDENGESDADAPTATGTTEDETSAAASRAVAAFADNMAEELQCGCCSEIVYRPVLVLPCQHFFCGSCVVLWVRNGGSVCPTCRGTSTVAMPFRALQPIVDALIRNAPHKIRAEREREQADEVYKGGLSIRIPPPKEASPPPDVNRSTEYVHPCPHCLPNNPYDWRCPVPIPDPTTDLEHAWHVDDGVPPGHGNCGNCENLLALRAPTTTKCDLCYISFCGIGVQDRCIALPMLLQHPHNLSTHADLILSAEVYDCFEGNTVEAEIMLEYLNNNGISPRHIYRDIVHHVQKQPRGFSALIELELFSDIHSGGALEPLNIDAPRSRACRMCAAEIFLWGLKEWWVRERQKGFLEECYANRKDCPDAEQCARQKDDLAHAKEFNHIFPARVHDELEVPEPTPQSDAPVNPPAPAPAPEPTTTSTATTATEAELATGVSPEIAPPETVHVHMAPEVQTVVTAPASPTPDPTLNTPSHLTYVYNPRVDDNNIGKAPPAPPADTVLPQLFPTSPDADSAMSVDASDATSDRAMSVDPN